MYWNYSKPHLGFPGVTIGIVALLAAIPINAQETMGPENSVVALEETEEGENYEQCAAFRADIDADLGEVLRAGCEPTLAQMSALMDNPIGNVAMMFNQVDAYSMEEPESGGSPRATLVICGQGISYILPAFRAPTTVAEG